MDERLRELERRSADSIGDAARYLVELGRVGTLDHQRLELAAHLGHEASLVLLGTRREPRTIDDLGEWILELGRFGKEPCVRAAVVAGDITLPLFERSSPDPRPRFALEAARRWTECPCEQHQDAARAVVAELGPVAGANAATGAWACWSAASDPAFAPRWAAYAVTSSVFATRSVAVVEATISRSLLAWVLQGIAVPRTTKNKAKPIFVSWTLTD